MKAFLRASICLLLAWLIIGWVSTYLSVRYLPSVRAVVRLKITSQDSALEGSNSSDGIDAFVGDLKPVSEYATLAESRLTRSQHNPIFETVLNLLSWPFSRLEYVLRGKCVRFGA